MKKLFIFVLCVITLCCLTFTACGKKEEPAKEIDDNRVSQIALDKSYIFKTSDGFNLAVKEGGWWPIVTKDNEATAFKVVSTAVPGFVYMIDPSTNRVVEVFQGSKENNAKFSMWDVQGSDNQFLIIMPTKEAYKNFLNEDNGNEKEFVIVTSNAKFFTPGAEGPVTGDDLNKAYKFIAYVAE